MQASISLPKTDKGWPTVLPLMQPSALFGRAVPTLWSSGAAAVQVIPHDTPSPELRQCLRAYGLFGIICILKCCDCRTTVMLSTWADDRVHQCIITPMSQA